MNTWAHISAVLSWQLWNRPELSVDRDWPHSLGSPCYYHWPHCLLDNKYKLNIWLNLVILISEYRVNEKAIINKPILNQYFVILNGSCQFWIIIIFNIILTDATVFGFCCKFHSFCNRYRVYKVLQRYHCFEL